MVYDYLYVSREVEKFANRFSIGKSEEGRELHCITVGNGEIPVVFAAAFHGLEYLTAPAVISFADAFTYMREYHSKIKLYVIPMVNPDGVEIAVRGINPQNSFHRRIIDNTGIIDFTRLWQSNARGVDINHNFDALWQSIKKSPSHTKYGGSKGESESETRAVVSFLRDVKPELFIAFHSQGKEIYYDFNGMENKFSQANAEFVAERCGYTACKPSGTASFGGAKDFYIQEFHKQAYTVELGEGSNPLPTSQLTSMTADTYKICMEFINRIIFDYSNSKSESG